MSMASSDEIDVDENLRLNTDAFMRFDLWAERAWQAAQAAVEVERARGDSDETCGLTDALIAQGYRASVIALASLPWNQRPQP